MRVGICDDDSKWYRRAKEIIEEYGKKTDTRIDVLYFPQGESLEIYEGDPLEAIFMDVDLGEKTGLFWQERSTKDGKTVRSYILPIISAMRRKPIIRNILFLC